MFEDFSVKAIKQVLFLFNLFFALTGLVLIVFGVAIKSYLTEYEPFIDDRYFSASSLLITSGSIIFIISFFGCCGAIKENRCMILTFSVLLSVVIILEIASAVTAYVLDTQTTELLNERLNQTMYEYQNVTDIRNIWDAVQHEFHCCGIHRPKDWMDSIGGLPVSCCDLEGVITNATCLENGINVYQKSCGSTLYDIVSSNAAKITGAAATVVGAQLLGMIFACYLGKQIQKKNYENV